MNERLRVRGSALDYQDTYVDVEITGYSIDGKVQLDAIDAPQSWEVNASRLKELRDQYDLAVLGDIVEHPIWGTVDEIRSAASDPLHASAEAELREHARELFRTAVRAQTNASSN
jgi:hypothetical protein